MIGLIQRVTSASVSVDNRIAGEIGQGILALVGIEKTDNQGSADRLLEKILNYRIFSDANDKMNLSVKDIKGGLLLVSQFTLAADTKSGTRAGFSVAMAPESSKILFHYLCQQAMNKYSDVAMGEFGANMQVRLCNDGPVTFILKS